jgi:hypothetical protein
LDILISAPYADKLPLKVAEYIRQDIPFAILVPLPLLNEIDRIGKTTIDSTVREKRQKMKLVISSSLGQAWLINHPKCRLDNAHHSVFFTQCSNNPELEKASHEIFGSWYTNDTKIEPRTMPHSQDIDTLVLNSIESLIRYGAPTKNRHAHGTRPPRCQKTANPGRPNIERTTTRWALSISRRSMQQDAHTSVAHDFNDSTAKTH